MTIRLGPLVTELCTMTGPNRLRCKTGTNLSCNRVPISFYTTVPSGNHNRPQQTDRTQELELLIQATRRRQLLTTNTETPA